MVNASLAKEHLNEAVYLLSQTTATAIFYILVFILYCLLFRLSYAQLWDDRDKINRQTVCTLIFQTVLLLCATLDVILANRTAQVLYVDHSTLPGGPLGLPAQLNAATLIRIGDVVGIIEEFLILAVLLWRVWVVWSGTRFAIPITIASVFLYLGNAVTQSLADAIAWKFDSTSLLAAPRAEEIINILSFVFSITSSVFMTSAIIARLLFVRWKHVRLMGKSDIAGQYLGIAAMLVESYALDTLWNIGILISYCLKYSPTANLFNSCIIQVDILTNFLVIYRVLSGRAWTRKTQDRLSSLRWASNGVGATTSGTVELRQTSVSLEDLPAISLATVYKP